MNCHQEFQAAPSLALLFRSHVQYLIIALFQFLALDFDVILNLPVSLNLVIFLALIIIIIVILTEILTQIIIVTVSQFPSIKSSLFLPLKQHFLPLKQSLPFVSPLQHFFSLASQLYLF
jgi:hypothetical protein